MDIIAVISRKYGYYCRYFKDKIWAGVALD